MKRLQRQPLFRFFSSLKLAVPGILSLATVLAVATVLESLYGARAVHVLVYGTAWFAGQLFLIGVNVLCAALSRYPWKVRQTGFVITHSGILIVLLGSVLTQRLGVDGNLAVTEGDAGKSVILSDLRLRLVDPDGTSVLEMPVPEAAVRRQGELIRILAQGGKGALIVDEYLPRAVVEKRFLPSPLPGVGMPAVRVELFNSRFRVEEWLQPRGPDKPHEINLGPAVLSFTRLWDKREEAAFASGAARAVAGSPVVLVEHQGRSYRVSVPDALTAWRPVGATGIEVKVLRYLPYAVVDKDKLVSRSRQPINPAVQILARRAGKEEQHTVFALFPEFTTLHRKHVPSGQPELGVSFQLEVPGATGENKPAPRGRLELAQTPDGRLLYRVEATGGRKASRGEVKPGVSVATGWMDLQFNVREWISDAVSAEVPSYVDKITGGDSQFLTAVRLRQTGEGAVEAPPFWLVEGASRALSIGGRDLYVALGKERLELPFAIHLEKFHVGMNPGTQKAASYESTVRVKDPGKGIEKAALISMNEPLTHGGYTFYQASYQMEPGRPPVSVFSVNYDPGRVVKYLGSLILVLGICVMFYMNPHYFEKILGGGKRGVA